MRVILIPVLLVMVLSIGFPLENPVGNISYEILRRVGLDVSMTPITVDMAMMRDNEGKNTYQKEFQVILLTRAGNTLTVNPLDLHFYRHKIPFNLYFEVLGMGGVMPEGKIFLCRSLEEFSGDEINTFSLKGLYEEQICP